MLSFVWCGRPTGPCCFTRLGTPGSNDYYAFSGPCGAGEGDCDGDNECQAGFVWVNNVGANCGFRRIVDLCEASIEGRNDYCALTGPCAAGEGGCDDDPECRPGLVSE